MADSLPRKQPRCGFEPRRPRQMTVEMSMNKRRRYKAKARRKARAAYAPPLKFSQVRDQFIVTVRSGLHLVARGGTAERFAVVTGIGGD